MKSMATSITLNVNDPCQRLQQTAELEGAGPDSPARIFLWHAAAQAALARNRPLTTTSEG
jgi:hypothetical protein